MNVSLSQGTFSDILIGKQGDLMLKKIFSVLLIFSFIHFSDACTTILVTKGASADGSMMVSHTDDNEFADQRIVYVPAGSYGKNYSRPVFGSNCNYPRIVNKSRAPAYNTPGHKGTIPVGYIEQVPRTYAYFDANYGIMNEHQLMSGECTCNAKVMAIPEYGKRIMFSPELSRIALERCKKAKDAVILVGELIDKYGYFGTGETLIFADAYEGWVMELCCSPDLEGGLWVAKKVPDGEVFVAANEFRIREIETDSPDMLYSKKIFKMAEEYGWWAPSEGKLDWLKTVSLGEFHHPYYSLRRVWRIFSIINPALNLNPWVADSFTEEYPFSIMPARKLAVKDMMALHRDHFEGTEFDMAKGIAAGPFSSPSRYIGKYDSIGGLLKMPETKQPGAWERPVCVPYTGYSYICQARGWLPDPIGGVMWAGFDVPHATCYMPFYAGVSDLPKSFQYGSVDKIDRSFAWRVFNFTANWAELKYSYMIKDIQAKQNEIETSEISTLQVIDTEALMLYQQKPENLKKYLTNYCSENAEKVIREWWGLADSLIVNYSSGYLNAKRPGERAGYPQEWLEKTEYRKGPAVYGKPAN